MIDAHCHIDLYPNPLQVAHRCEQAGVTTLAMTNLPSHFALGKQHLQGFRNIRLALGLHPLHALRHQAEYALFKQYLPLTSYVGEVGLDFSREGLATKQQQLQSFAFVLRCVQQQRKLLSIHSRGAEQQVVDMLVEYHCKLAIFHWYTGSLPVLRTIVGQGYYFSVNPAMIRSEKGRQIIATIPRNKILTETDGPFVQVGNALAEPAHVEIVLNYLALHWEVSIQYVTDQIQDNFKELLSHLRSR
ncbi:TatD family deoxyribonuclease [Hymenobacter sediminis]|uniref:Qat anti-phage system TatD family nuclease QatD n=1 Tax=Hymenobacter sediminis TaxID=2218621 RepID=UPI000DA65EBA|nr:Qat anti-phage system TatD family nuclease QatD [Hymenobacter sediminis]RPD44114.1 TatD family deoxyribonuclease [Hymenobacter sediminis]